MVGSVGIEPTEPLQRQIYSLDRLLNGITTQNWLRDQELNLGLELMRLLFYHFTIPRLFLIIHHHSPSSTTSFVPLHMLSSTCPPTRSDVTSTSPSCCSTVFLPLQIHLSLSQQQDVLLLMSYHHIIIWFLVFPLSISVFSVFPY